MSELLGPRSGLAVSAALFAAAGILRSSSRVVSQHIPTRSVSERRDGVRIALGAQATSIVRLVVVRVCG